jgi:lipopolysaccharide transport system permease protein
MPQASGPSHYKRITAGRQGLAESLGELWQYRELLFFLTWRDVKVLYKQTVLGGLWAVLQPFLSMVIFSLFFGRLAKMPSDGVPYPVFSFTALLPWTFFANSLTQVSASMVASQNILKKVYFPRLAIPISGIFSKLVDFSLAFVTLIALMFYFEIPLTVRVAWILPLLLLSLTSALGVGLWLSAMNVQFRDIRYVVPFLVQTWLYATPVVYPSSLMDERWRIVYSLNPMVGVVEGFRWALLGTRSATPAMITLSSVVAVITLISGVWYFRRMERAFADVV